MAAAVPIVFAVVSDVSSRSGPGDAGRTVRDGPVVDGVEGRLRSATPPSLPLGATSVRVELYGRAPAVTVIVQRDDTTATIPDVTPPYAATVPLSTGVGTGGLQAFSARSTPRQAAPVPRHHGVPACDVRAEGRPRRDLRRRWPFPRRLRPAGC